MFDDAVEILDVARGRARSALAEAISRRDGSKAELAQAESDIVRLTERVASASAALAVLRAAGATAPLRVWPAF